MISQRFRKNRINRRRRNPETPGQTVKAQTVRTGDGANLSNWMLVCILSCVAVIVCVMITRMKKRSKRGTFIMGMTMTQKILAAHAGLDHVEARTAYYGEA